MSPKCPSCSKLITYVVASPVSITTPQGNIEGYCFLCPSCKAAIGFARRGFSCKQLEALARIEAWIDMDLLKMFFILGAMEHTQSHALRGFAHELRAKWFGQATRFLQEMGRGAAQERGWSRRRIAAFDFRAWSHCWVASVEGLLVQNWTPPTGKFKPGRMSDVLRAVFIEPNFEKPANGSGAGQKVR